MINPESMAELVLFCDWCGEELEEGNCPVCGWHSDLFDKYVVPARKILAEREAAKNEEKVSKKKGK